MVTEEGRVAGLTLVDALVAWASSVLVDLDQDYMRWRSGVYSVVDCVFSAQARYESTVMPMLLKRLPERPGLADEPDLAFSTFIADVESFGENPWEEYGGQVLTRQVLAGRRKVQVCYDIAQFFVDRKLETNEDLQALGEEALIELVLGPLQDSVRGVGTALARYLCMLLGIETQVKFDTMIQRFFEQLGEAVGWTAGPIEMDLAESVMRDAAGRLGTPPARLDHGIWQFMSQGGRVELSGGVEALGRTIQVGLDEGPSTSDLGSALKPLFRRISYEDLNSRQKESYNFHKLAAELADFGFTCMQLADDWEGADFLAVHYLGDSVLKVQLKGRLTIAKKYEGKDLWIAFPHQGVWFLIEHDRLVRLIGRLTPFLDSPSWEAGAYSTAKPSKVLLEYLRPYCITRIA